ncbi:MAG TPA: alpha/beta fold hydrolase, partial [Sphingomicrobium sp.]|nr:alpha/beta fold hydrolase [Sphingomicrobium sp.]
MRIFWRSFATATLLLTFTASADAQERPSSVARPIAAQYLKPQQLVDVGGGRKLNLVCMGAGKHVILFDSGLSDWSVIWALVQPAVARRARACSYDRAGLGYSDAPRSDRSPMEIVEDMHALVTAAKLDTPLVAVGHSLGGFNMKLYAAVYPNEVAALVLVDPAEDRAHERTREFLRARYGAPLAARVELHDNPDLKAAVSHFNECAESAKKHDLDPASAEYKKCTDPVRGALGPEIAAERAKHQVTAMYQETVASEFANSVYADNLSDAAYRMLFRPGAFGSKPLIILTHSIYNRDDPVEAAGEVAWNELHRQSAMLSSRGRNIVVP